MWMQQKLKLKPQLLHLNMLSTHLHPYVSVHVCTCHVLYIHSCGVIKQGPEKLQGYINTCCGRVWLCDGGMDSLKGACWYLPCVWLWLLSVITEHTTFVTFRLHPEPVNIKGDCVEVVHRYKCLGVQLDGKHRRPVQERTEPSSEDWRASTSAESRYRSSTGGW